MLLCGHRVRQDDGHGGLVESRAFASVVVRTSWNVVEKSGGAEGERARSRSGLKGK